MAWGKTEDQKQSERDAKAAAEYAASPIGQAHAAFDNGSAFFQLELDVSTLTGAPSAFGASGNVVKRQGRPDLLGQIEEIGWRLEHVGYVFVETGSTSSNRMMSSGQAVVTRGVVQGIYLFRRAA